MAEEGRGKREEGRGKREEGPLAGEFLPILDILREWDAGGVWVLFDTR
jgi:hypothetical protein